MALKTNETATLFSQKKLLGKAHTSNLNLDVNESIGSTIQSSSGLLFGEAIPTNPNLTLNTVQSSTVEYVEFSLVTIAGSTYDANDQGGGAGSDSGESSQTSGPHAYAFKFKSSYETDTNNSKAGNGSFDNSKIVHETLGKVQIIPPFYSRELVNPFIIKIYEDNGSGGIGTEIPLLDNIDWQVDTYNGVLFVQDYSSSKIPAFARAFIYVGKMLDEVVSAAAGSGGSGGGGGGREKQDYVVSSLTISGSAFSISNSELSNSAFDKTLIDVFVNGQLLLSGTDSQVGAAEVDYFASATNKIKFGFDLKPDDIVSVVTYNSGSSSNSADYLLVNATGSLSSGRALSLGTGLTSSDGGPGNNFEIKVEKELVFNELLSGSSNGSNTLFALSNAPFSSSEISIFVNGQLQTPPGLTTFQDYSVTGSNVFFTTGSVPTQGSLVMAIYQKVAS